MKYLLTILVIAVSLSACITVKCPCKCEPKNIDNGLMYDTIIRQPYPIYFPGLEKINPLDKPDFHVPYMLDTILSTRVLPL